MHYLSPVQTDATLLANNTLLDATFCVRLHTLLHVFACYILLFRDRWSVAQQCWISLHCSSNIRELTQRLRRWQRERQKSNRFRQAKQQLCTCITLFCTFLCRRCTTTTWNYLISRFVEDGNKRKQFSFSLPELWCSPLQFNYSKICQHLTNETRWNKRDKVWSSANSLFKWRFRSRRRCRCVNSLSG